MRKTDDSEVNNHTFRSDRIFQINGEWFFCTRENVNVGPFGSGELAKTALQRFVRVVAESPGQFGQAKACALGNYWNVVEYR